MQQPKDCRSFAQGYCRYGAQCKFKHPIRDCVGYLLKQPVLCCRNCPYISK